MRALSPRSVAQALGVSESSLKRWCDQGLIATEKTAGGHRRLSLDSVVQFVQTSNRTLARPELLGFPAATGRDERGSDELRAALLEAFTRGDDQACRQLVLGMHLAGRSACAIVDEVVGPVFSEIGEQWDCHRLDIYQERRSCEICLRLLYELEALQPESEPDAPLAIGGTIECDGYSLPTTAVELVFRQNGWRARSLGSRLPFGSMLNAIHDNRPDLFWISVSHISDESRFVDEYSEFYEQVGHELPIVLGGRAIHEKLRPQLRFATCCDRLQQLESFIQSLRPSRLHETGP